MASMFIFILACLPVFAFACYNIGDCDPGFFCADREPWAAFGTCKKLEPGAGKCYSFDGCGTELRCATNAEKMSLRCVSLPDYSKSGLPQGFESCTNAYNCSKSCDSGPCNHDCARGHCHVVGVMRQCKTRWCPPLTTCVGGSCVYGTEGTQCDLRSREPCLRGLRCEKEAGKDTGVCTKGRVGMPCKSANRCGPGLVCGSSGKCASDADGQPCASDFQCPPTFSCARERKKCTRNRILKDFSIPVPSRAWPCKWENDCNNIFVRGERFSRTNCINGVCIPEGLDQNCTNPGCGFQLSCRNGKCLPGFEGVNDEGQTCLRGLKSNRTCDANRENYCTFFCAKGEVPDYKKIEDELYEKEYGVPDAPLDKNSWPCSN